MATRDQLEPFHWKSGCSGNPAGRPKKPRRSLDAVQRLESLGVDPLEEAIALARDTSLPKVVRLRAWIDLCGFAYPRLAPVVPHENVSVRLEELERSWDIATLEEFNQAFSAELDTLPDEAKAGLKKLEAMGRIGPLIMQALIKFVERRHEQAKAQDRQDGQSEGLSSRKTGQDGDRTERPPPELPSFGTAV
jgi:hypothetical protein